MQISKLKEIGKYHLEATLTMSKTLPLYMLSLTSFPFASYKPEKRLKWHGTCIEASNTSKDFLISYLTSKAVKKKVSYE